MDLSKSFEYFSPASLNDARVHIVGCGSVGSTIAENLARSGVKNFTLWDFDKVEPKNIVNQMFFDNQQDLPKVEALRDILVSINPEAEKNIDLKPKGWQGQNLSGYIFLCVDSIEIRKKIVEQHYDSPYVIAMFDFRTGLEDAQHFAADWKDERAKKSLLNSMEFTDEEANEATPVSACGVTLGVCPTVRIICAYGAANFMNFVKGKEYKKIIMADAFNFTLNAM